jgi:hypothetical protein
VIGSIDLERVRAKVSDIASNTRVVASHLGFQHEGSSAI